jgi:hypothetical protein
MIASQLKAVATRECRLHPMGRLDLLHAVQFVQAEPQPGRQLLEPRKRSARLPAKAPESGH